MATITRSDVVITLHVIAVVIAFGGALAYPLWFRMLRNGSAEQRAFFHRGQALLGKFLITPAIVLVFATGAYLASDWDVWGEAWILVPTAILVVILALGAGVLGPGEERLSRDALSSDQGDYVRILRRVKTVTWFLAALVLAATFMMVAHLPE